jgi:hypothetical protein
MRTQKRMFRRTAALAVGGLLLGPGGISVAMAQPAPDPRQPPPPRSVSSRPLPPLAELIRRTDHARGRSARDGPFLPFSEGVAFASGSAGTKPAVKPTIVENASAPRRYCLKVNPDKTLERTTSINRLVPALVSIIVIIILQENVRGILNYPSD